jgi:hypothetical protein
MGPSGKESKVQSYLFSVLQEDNESRREKQQRKKLSAEWASADLSIEGE